MSLGRYHENVVYIQRGEERRDYRAGDHLLLSFAFSCFPDKLSCVPVQLTKDYTRNY
jgi:hypothetical protein